MTKTKQDITGAEFVQRLTEGQEAIRRITAELASTPQGVPELKMFKEWHGHMSSSEYHSLLQDGIDADVLQRDTVSGNFTLTDAGKAEYAQQTS